ncbi:nickel ABC transporter, nickel/metallophore periplasmic binding protein [Clostridium butyricum]|uniref:nickel ABC transporter substrate-binding protein n=1 Tax=Clostridium butyricum TaxID=1492 RepID=UPI000F53BC66|nr:nickel ABC transporter substrate-binding protein [Clostridium butyricum]RQN11053.1 nickel ABC transporter, nickel/metallophore periplasmic binding protein [Clostridium butyricum]
MIFSKKKMVKILTAFLTASMLLTGCGTAGGKNSSDTKSQLVYANFRDLRDLNPHLYSGEMFAQNMIFEALVKIEDDGSFTPWLAESWSISEDGTTYVFKLREDVSFTDREKFNAESAKANFDAIMDNAERHTWLESVRLMQEVDAAGGKSVEVTGEYELTLRLSEAYYPFLVELGVIRPFRFISPKCFIDGTTKNGVSSIIGTGSYYLKENHVDEYSVFKANENYWGDKPEIEEIVVKVIPDNQTRVMALENGELDLIFGTDMIDSETFLKFKDKEGFGTLLSDPVSTRMMIINTTDEILSDVKVRKAIQHATDRETISKDIFSEIESPADTVLAKTVPYADIGLEPYEYNVEKAKELLTEAGWNEVEGKTYREKDGKELAFTLNYCSDNVTEKTISEFYQSELAKIGINLTIVGEEEQAARDRMKSGDFDIIFNISWGAPYDPQSFLAGMRMPVYGDYAAQQGLEEKAKIDENILEALKSTDETLRQGYYSYVLSTLHDEAVYIPVTYERNRAIYSNKIDNVTFDISRFEVPMDKMKLAEK